MDIFGLDRDIDDDHSWVSLGETEPDGYSQELEIIFYLQVGGIDA